MRGSNGVKAKRPIPIADARLTSPTIAVPAAELFRRETLLLATTHPRQNEPS
jgi:hypothetical protein